MRTRFRRALSMVAITAIEAGVRLLRIGQNVQEVDSREYAREFYTLTPPRAAFVNQPNTLDEFGPALIAINSQRGGRRAAYVFGFIAIGEFGTGGEELLARHHASTVFSGGRVARNRRRV